MKARLELKTFELRVTDIADLAKHSTPDSYLHFSTNKFHWNDPTNYQCSDGFKIKNG